VEGTLGEVGTEGVKLKRDLAMRILPEVSPTTETTHGGLKREREVSATLNLAQHLSL